VHGPPAASLTWNAPVLLLDGAASTLTMMLMNQWLPFGNQC